MIDTVAVFIAVVIVMWRHIALTNLNQTALSATPERTWKLYLVSP